MFLGLKVMCYNEVWTDRLTDRLTEDEQSDYFRACDFNEQQILLFSHLTGP